MTYWHALLAACVANLLLACGGDAAQSGASAGAGGTASAAGGQASGGRASGGGSSGGSGGATVCCNAFPTCPAGERQAQGSECPGPASCHQVSICCSTIWCIASKSSGSGGATGNCNGATCTATQACIAYRTVGGTRVTPDAGACPSGEHLEGTICQADFSYKCADLNGTCNDQPVTCACAEPQTNSPGVCPAGFGSCSEPGPTVDTEAKLICQQLAP